MNKKLNKRYNGNQMIKKSRMVNYFNTLDIKIQNEITNRIDELVIEEKEYCDKGNFEHMCNLLSLLAIY